MTIATVLSETESARLQDEEAVIERGAQQIGEALAVIRNERLYRSTHGTFDDYCQDRWGITPQHANRQISAAEVVAVLEPIGSIPESQARELAPLRDDPDRMREVWEKANETTGGKPTAEAIREARDPETAGVQRVQPISKPRRAPLPDQARTTGWELRKSVERLQRLAADDRFNANKEAVAPQLRGHLTDAIEVCQDLLDRLNN